jgi:hypothetical protein
LAARSAAPSGARCSVTEKRRARPPSRPRDAADLFVGIEPHRQRRRAQERAEVRQRGFGAPRHHRREFGRPQFARTGDRLADAGAVRFEQLAAERGRTGKADARDLFHAEMWEIGVVEPLELERIAERHDPATLDGAATDRQARGPRQREPAERRQRQRQRGESDRRAARMVGARFE